MLPKIHVGESASSHQASQSIVADVLSSAIKHGLSLHILAYSSQFCEPFIRFTTSLNGRRDVIYGPAMEMKWSWQYGRILRNIIAASGIVPLSSAGELPGDTPVHAQFREIEAA